jgi:hypothetical protein
MADRAVRIQLPIDGRIMTVDMDDTMTTREVIDELLANNVLQPNDHGYQMGRKSGDLLNFNDRIGDLNLSADDVLRVIPATDAGCGG